MTTQGIPQRKSRRVSFTNLEDSMGLSIYARSEPFPDFISRYKGAQKLVEKIFLDDWSDSDEDVDSNAADNGLDHLSSVQTRWLRQGAEARPPVADGVKNSFSHTLPIISRPLRHTTSYSGPFLFPSRRRRLPLELVDHVLDFVAGEILPGATLASCSLVCRMWHRMSLSRLYEHVVLYSAAGYTSLVSSLQRNLSLAKQVTALQLGLDIRQRPLLPAIEDRQRQAWISMVPIHLPTILTNLTDIVIRDVGNLHRSFFVLFRQFTSVTFLHVSAQALLATPPDLARVLWSLPSLQHAVFEVINFAIYTKDPAPTWKQRRKSLPSLKTLALKDWGVSWGEWMLTMEMTTLEVLVLIGASLFPYNTRTVYQEPAIIQSAQKCLRELTVALRWKEESQDVIAHLGRTLSGHDKLEELNIGIDLNPSISDFTSLVSGLSTKRLAALSFMSDLRSADEMKDDFVRLDNVLQRPTFRNLRTMSFVATGSSKLQSTRVSIATAIREWMPKSEARGILQIQVTDKYDIDLGRDSFVDPHRKEPRISVPQPSGPSSSESDTLLQMLDVAQNESAQERPYATGGLTLVLPWNIIHGK